MYEQRRRREDGEPEPLDSGTVAALQAADPHDRARTLLELQRLHGNDAVQRIIRALEMTDAGRDARIQAIGDRAEEPAPSGRLDKALLYREAIATELDASPLASRNERELVQDNVNTIGQIFANYQTALHLFEDAVTGGMGESVPRRLATEVLQEVAREVFEPVLDACPDLAPGLDEAAAEVSDVPETEKREAGQSAPAHSLRNLVIAERRRVAATHRRMIRGQTDLMARAGDRAALAAAAVRLDELETGSHSAGELFKKLMERWQELMRGRAEVTIVLDEQWNVIRAHIAAPEGRRLAAQLLEGGTFDLNDLHLTRHVTWQAAELATCRALITADGRPTQFARNERGGPFMTEFQHRLRTEGLPHTRILSGD